jgi:hypothetical protein
MAIETAGQMRWKPVLARWSNEMMQSSLAPQVTPPPESPDWLGNPPATAREIALLEKRLGMALPPSYKSFLLTSNGWRRTTFAIGRLRPAKEVDWYRTENEQAVATWSDSGSDRPDEEYYDYRGGSAPDYRADHIESLVQVSDYEDGLYLLNPKAVTPDGEWEAWFFANWIPGAERYPSFAHLMLAQFQSFMKVEKRAGAKVRLPKLEVPKPKVPRVAATSIAAPKEPDASIEALMEQMQSANTKTQAKALRTFFGRLKGRPNAEREPALVKVLSDLFYAAKSRDVRCACVAGITEWAPAGTAPAPLLDALSDPDPGVVLHGISALHYFPQKDAVEPLCRFVASRVNVLFNENAMLALAEIGDARAMPVLADVLLDTSNAFEQSFGTAGVALGRLGSPSFDVLEKALEHPDARVRFGAVCGIDISGHPRRTAWLKRMENDPDSQVRKRASTPVGNSLRHLFKQ